MKPIFKYCTLLLLSGLVVALVSCKREEVDFIGPSYISAPEGFSVPIFTGTPSPIDFTVNSVAFNATFTSSVSWTLTVKGQQSGALYKTNGISDGLTNVIWKGTHSGVSFFKTGETAIATLSFFGTSYTASTSVVISKARNFNGYGQHPPGGDFENPTLIKHASGWHAFNDPTPIPNSTQGVGSSEIDYKGNVVTAIQGNNYYYIRGLGNQQYFVSGIQYDTGMPLSPATPADANNVWVNMYIYGTGDPNTQVELEYQEADADGTQAGYQGTDDDAFVARIVLDHVGWKLFSFQYSKLTPSLNAPFGGSGNKIHEPNTLRSFDLVLIKKSKADSPVEVYFDYPIITTGGPFDPTK
jgi:hypothetical protein